MPHVHPLFSKTSAQVGFLDRDHETAPAKSPEIKKYGIWKLVSTAASDTKNLLRKRACAAFLAVKPAKTKLRHVQIINPALIDMRDMTSLPIEQTSFFLFRSSIQKTAVAFVQAKGTSSSKATIAKETKVFANTWLQAFSHHYNHTQPITNPRAHFDATLFKTSREMIDLKATVREHGTALLTELTKAVEQELRTTLMAPPVPLPRTVFPVSAVSLSPATAPQGRTGPDPMPRKSLRAQAMPGRNPLQPWSLATPAMTQQTPRPREALASSRGV